MLDLRYVTDQPDAVREGLARRGFKDTKLLDDVATLARKRREVQAALDQDRAERNQVSASLAKVDKASAEFEATRARMKELGGKISGAEETMRATEAELEDKVLFLPNIPHASVPNGASEADNVERRTWGTKPSFAFKPKDHVDLGTALGIFDFERGTKISGARFTVLRGAGARLERALMQFMLDMHSDEHGYTEVWPPVIIKDSAMRGTSQLPKFKDDAFRIAMEPDAEGKAPPFEWYLAPTAEVPVTNLHADEVIEASALPITYTAYTPCFRREAGSYGKDTRGFIRQHQFDKVELVRFTRPETAEAELEALTSHAEAVLQRLGLHYRVVELCGADLGFASQKTYDLEVWLPGQDAYREISSCSWFGEFQARRAKIRYRPDANPKTKPQLAHTLNGSGLAIGRTLVAILEQCQTADGTVIVPEALRPYMAGMTELRA
ncbi:MAG: serine--tRNA ligase [Myxococcales bacterium]|nr:serine--tRNA ligase [Myxococcales bacterium]